MDYQLLSDELLIKLLRVSDEGAFKEIYRRHWKPLFMAAQHKLKEIDTIEELLQETFLKLWQNRATQAIDNLGGYLYTSLKYQLIDHYKKQLQEQKYAHFMLSKGPQEGFSPEKELDINEIVGIFEKTIQQLPEKTALIFRLSRVEFKATRQIAEQLNLPERTVEYHITQALRLLRMHLKDFLPTLFLSMFYDIII